MTVCLKENCSDICDARSSRNCTIDNLSGLNSRLQLENILLILFSSIGIPMITALLMISFYFPDIRNRHGFFAGLLLEEWFYSVARLVWSKSRLQLALSDSVANQVSTSDCVYSVFPVVIIIGWQFSPVPVLCIAIEQFFAVRHPLLYQRKWRKRYAWYINLIELALMIATGIVISILAIHIRKKVSGMCYSDAFVDETYCLYMFIAPSVVVLTSSGMTLCTLCRVVRLMRAVTSENCSLSRSTWLRYHSNVVHWLILLSSFGVLFIFVPNIIWLASTYGSVKSGRALLTLRQSSNCIHTLKAIIICLSSLWLQEYRSKIADLMKQVKTKVEHFDFKTFVVK